MIAPITPRISASTMNSWMMSRLRAPIAFMMPISRVRSVTLTIMMLAIPMEPTTREMAAIPPIRNVNWSMMLPIWSIASSTVWALISYSSCLSWAASDSVWR